MSDHDARKQSLTELHERRKQVIRLHRKKYGVMQIVDLTGLSWPAVRAAIDLYEAGGMAAVKPKLPAAQARTGSSGYRHVMSRIASASIPIAARLCRRFHAGHGMCSPRRISTEATGCVPSVCPTRKKRLLY